MEKREEEINKPNAKKKKKKFASLSVSKKRIEEKLEQSKSTQDLKPKLLPF